MGCTAGTALSGLLEQGGHMGAIENDRAPLLPLRCPSLGRIAPEQPNKTPTSAPTLSPPAIEDPRLVRRTNPRLDAGTAPRYGGS